MELVTSNGINFSTVSLAPLADASLSPKDDWSERIWKKGMPNLPRGQHTFAGIPFYVIPPGENQERAAVSLIGKRYKQKSGGGSIPMGRKAAAIYVLHAASYINNNSGRVTATYRVRYSDGSVWEIPVRNLHEIADFMSVENLSSDCQVGWYVKDSFFPYHYCVFVLRLLNPHPNREIAFIEFRPSGGSAVVSIVGLTLAEKAAPLVPLEGIELVKRPEEVAKPSGRLVVKLRDSGKATAARVAVRDTSGRYYRPPDGLNYLILNRGQRFFWTDGGFSLPVPAGILKLAVFKGFEYRPQELTIEVPEGKKVRRTVNLERWINLPEQGWYSGEMHIHPCDQEPEDTDVCLRAEDIRVGNMVPSSTGFNRRYDGDQFFTGRPERWPGNGYIAFYGEEYRNNVFGHICLFNQKSFWRLTGSGSEYNIDDYPANTAIMDWVHDQGGFVSVAHMGIPPVNYAVPWEVSVDVALGKADAVDQDLKSFDRSKDRALDLWYRFLNCGYKLPISCSTDAALGRDWQGMPPANIRVCANVGRRLTYSRWIRAVANGRSFVTRGPAIFLTVEGKEPGSTVNLKQGKNSLHVHAESLFAYPLRRLEIVANGMVVASVAGNGSSRLVIDETIKLQNSAWLAARTEAEPSRNYPSDALLAHTAPVYCQGLVPLNSPEDARFFMKEIGGLLDWVEHKGAFADPKHKSEVKAVFRRARAIYEKQAEGEPEPRNQPLAME